MEIIFNYPEWANGEYVEVMITDGEYTVKVEEGAKYSIEANKSFMTQSWIDQGSKRIESDKRYSEFLLQDRRAEQVAYILQKKHPKKEIWIGTSRDEVWVYHKNQSVMKIVNVKEFLEKHAPVMQ